MAVNVRNIPAGFSPVDTIAALLLEESGGCDLTDTLVLLPNRRACRELSDAFVRLNGMQPTILPRIQPLGDPDEDEFFFADSLPQAAELAPAVSPVERTLLFTRLIAARQQELTGGGGSLAQAAYLAGELGRLLDAVESEELAFDALSDLVPEEYAAHWQKTLDFLKIITEYFPQILTERGFSNPAARRTALLKMQCALWRQTPPSGRVVIAGTPGAFPAVRELIKTVAEMPSGTVYLNDLDRCLDEHSWQLIDESHPQYEIRQLLDYLGLTREQVADAVPATASGREKLISETMRPAAATDRWREISAQTFPAEALNGVHLISCREFREEALTVAAIMRHTLETPEKTAALVTSDRNLARRVAAELRRWDINVDDSAGRPLTQTPVGIFLRLVAECCEKPDDDVSLLGLMKHPFTTAGGRPAVFRTRIREYERKVLRGGEKDETAESFIREKKELLRPLFELCRQPQADFRELLRAHLQTAESLAADDEKGGAEKLWKGDDGEAAALFFSALLENAETLPIIKQNQYGDFIASLMSSVTVRPKYGTHPRLKILGPIEARLSGFDTVIIGEVNEGAMPAAAPAGAWMSRPMKKQFGLPLPEKAVGVTARDFAHLLAQKEVYLTRAERVGGTPMTKSRWWMRLETVLTAAGINPAVLADDVYPQTAAFLDRPRTFAPIRPPMPKPPLAARPRELWANAIENLMRDPYIIFAKHILKLKPLEELNRKPGIIDLGIIVHAVLEKFNRRFPGQLPDNAEEILTQIGRQEFAAAGIDEQTLAFWQPALDKIVRWVLDKENGYRREISRVFCEAEGRYDFEAPGGTFTVGARADRIDLTVDGKINVIDYKTGRARTKKEISAGYAPQLPIEGIIALNGGFAGIPATEVNSLRYWRLGKEEICVDEKINEILERNLENIKRLIAVFDNEDKPYLTQPNPKYAPAYSDYEHLSRIKEWGANDRHDD